MRPLVAFAYFRAAHARAQIERIASAETWGLTARVSAYRYPLVYDDGRADDA